MNNQALLDEIRAAFDGDDIFQMRRALRKAHDLVSTLTVDGPQTFALLLFMTTFYRNTLKETHKGFWNFDQDENFQGAMAITENLLKGSTVE